jgi:primosomal protein N' (replication factor Y)
MLVSVVIPNTRLDCLTYTCENEAVSRGSLVLVELRQQHTLGVVAGFPGKAETSYIKPILEVVEAQFLAPELLELLDWTRRYYFSSWGEMLTLAHPRGVYRYKPKRVREPSYGNHQEIKTPPTLDLRQHQAVSSVLPFLHAGEFKVSLLFGAVGLDRTEIYLRLIEETLRLGKSAIVLRPEITLTESLILRFAGRFPAELVPLHSGLTRAVSKSYWQQVRTGRFRVVVGSRSAVFAPLKNLGLVVIDDEHDSNYKEKRQPHYHARDVGIMRAKLEKAVVVLGSATPSVESFYNSRSGKYELIDVREERRVFPSVTVVDMRREKGAVFSKTLRYEIQKRLYSSSQILLFVNRRGYSPFLLCADCGFVPRCPECNLPLVYHRHERNLKCHFCRYEEPGFDRCPKCQGTNFSFRGTGTQRIEKEFRIINKKPSIIRLDSDTGAQPEDYERICRQFNAGRAQVLVGTQLAVRDVIFPRVTLAGIIDADTILNLPDFHSAERTFQTLWRVITAVGAGRKSQVIIQTFHPQHYAIRCAQRRDFSRFYTEEFEARKAARYPPFARLALVKVSDLKQDNLDAAVERLNDLFEKSRGVWASGPVVASRQKKRGSVYQWLLKTRRDTPFHTLIDRKVLRDTKAKLDIDIDPVETV